MKHTRRLLALVMASLLALPLLCVTALAEDTGHTFVVDNAAEGYTYVLYQMFKGDTAPATAGQAAGKEGLEYDDYVLSNIEWGDSVKLAATKTAMYDLFGLTGDKRNAAGVAEALAATTDPDIFHTMMTTMARKGLTGGASLTEYRTLTGPAQFSVNGETKTGYGTTGLPSGYYLVRNTGVPVGDTEATYSDYIIRVAGADVFAEPKEDVMTTIKKVQDINDTTETALTTAQDSADYDIGDAVPFTLTATLPANYSAYDALGYYNLKFEDDMCAGYTWDGKATIYYGADTTGDQITFTDVTGTAITHDGVTETLKSAYTGGKVWMFDCGNLKERDRLAAGMTIHVEYTATLNSKALADSNGNENQHRIIYSSNPTDRDQLNASAFDKNVVFTYKTVFSKVDDSNKPLTGADFKLEKNVNGTWVDVTALNSGTDNPIKKGSTEGTTFEFTGLDDGDYRLTEITTPAGYNTMEPQVFTIAAEHEVDDPDPQLISLTGTGAQTITLTQDAENPAVLKATIVNHVGVVLPTSGGMGTRIIQIAGIALLGVSVVIVMGRRRAQAA